MKVFMIGGTGLLGSEAAKVLIERGHEVTSIALPPLPEGAVLPPEMKIEYGNYLEMSDDELRAYLTGCEGFVFAAGVDERVEGPAPIYNLYKKYNIDPINRLLKLAKEEYRQRPLSSQVGWNPVQYAVHRQVPGLRASWCRAGRH